MSLPVKQLIDNIYSFLSRPVYLDNNATTPMDKRVQSYMTKVQKKLFGNPSSLHSAGFKSRDVIESARQKAAGVINASPEEIIFTSGGTEANNTIIKGIAALNSKGHFITSVSEHQSVLTVFKSLEKKGFIVTYIGTGKDGRVNITELKNAIREDTLLISIMHVNNETGVINDIRQIAQTAKSKNILFHSDIVQSFGKLKIDVKEIPVDYLTFSAHKINGPKGCGAIFLRAGAPFHPLIEGGHQEGAQRAGTEGFINIAGFGKACEVIAQMDKDAYLKRITEIRNKIFTGIKKIYPGAELNGSLEGFPSTLNIKLPGAHNSEMIAFLDYYKIAVSAGSACVAGSKEVSHVLLGLGLTQEEASSSIRISIGKYNTLKDAGKFLSILKRFIKKQKNFFNYVFANQLTEEEIILSGKLFVDLRSEKQISRHKGLKGSINMKPNMKELKKLPKYKEIVLICEDGYISNLYAPMLRKAGWKDVKVLFGGWKNVQHKA